MTSARPRAACLTPPAIGGIAVIQIVGDGAIPLTNPHLRKGRSPVDLSLWPADELRLCRLVEQAGPENEEVIDDAVVCIRRTEAGAPVIDLNLHGGARIVQRVLLMLQRQGAQIVPAEDLLPNSWPAPTRLHAAATKLLLHAKTRRVAVWLSLLPDRLIEKLQLLLSDVQQGRVAETLRSLDDLLGGANRIGRLIAGVRAVLIGPPNCGKSTLANALAEREHAVVSDTPGTTRDWTEHAAAIQGVPFTFIDTAGIRRTDDPIEIEAIRRANQQISSADVLIRVNDLSEPPDVGNEALVALASEHMSVLDVYNKVDLPPHPGYGAFRTGLDGADPVFISARTGQGLDLLRVRLLERAGLPVNAAWPVGPFTSEQIQICRQAREALSQPGADRTAAVRDLQNLLQKPFAD